MEKFNLTSSKRNLLFLLLFCFLISLLKSYAQPTVAFSPIITGLTAPMQIVNAGDQTNRIFIAEKGGTIKVFAAPIAPATAWTAAGTFLTLTGIVSGGEQGLLSMAFHPQFETNGLFFVYYNNTQGDLELARYKVSQENPNLADPNSKVVVITIPHPDFSNHNGGELHFGSDGYLYLSTGDGGSGGDPNNNAQNTSVLLGKILRFNVSTTDQAPYYTVPAGNPFGNLVYAVGLRNPFRWSFDSANGDMWIGDVGQDTWEEINYRTGATTSGANFGWRCYEGNSTYNTGGCTDIAQYHFPTYQYSTRTVGNSVVGGVVYRGLGSPEMQGYYIGADFQTGDIHVIGPVGGTQTTTVQETSFTGISDFGEAENGEIFAARLSAGTVYALSAADPLPVNLVSFTGISGNEGVRLSWKTTEEKNFRQFDIEYSSNAKTFAPIGTVISKSSLTGSDYQFFHSVNTARTLYYRLKMIDQDDTFDYSKTISVNSGNEDISANFVRPSLIESKTMHVLLEEPFNSFELVSANGNVLMKRDITNEKGDLNIPLESVSSGMYIVRLQGNERILNQKVLIVK